MLLTLLAVAPVLAVLLVMAAQPLFEIWDARASERAGSPGADDRCAGAEPVPATEPVWPGPTPYPESPGHVAAALRIPAPRRPLPVRRAPVTR